MANDTLYRAFYENPKKPTSLNDNESNSIRNQANGLKPQQGKVWQRKLTAEGEDAYRELFPDTPTRPGYSINVDEADAALSENARKNARSRLQTQRASEAQTKYQSLLDANAAKTRLNFLTDNEINDKLAKETANNKRHLQMKHINGIYRKQIEALNTQRMQLAKEIDTLRSRGKINDAKWAQFEELGKQIETLNGKMYDGERAFKTFSELQETKENQLMHNLYEQLSSPVLPEEQRQAILDQIKKLESVDQRAALDHWITASKKDFEEHNAAIDKERADIKAKIDAESEVKDGDRELEEAVNNATREFSKQEQVKGDTAFTRAQGRMIEKYKEKINSGDYRGAQVILEQHPDIAKMVGYDPVTQRKFNRRKNSEKKVREYAKREKTAYGTEFSEDMIKLAAEVRAKNPGMTAKQALETVRNQMLGIKTPTGETFVSPKDRQAAREFIARQAERNTALQVEAAKHKRQFDYMADRIGNAVRAGNLTPQQGQLLLNKAKNQYETSMSTLAVKNGGGGKQRTFTPQPPTVRQQSVDGIVGNMLAVRDAEAAQKFDSLSDADKAAQLIRMNYDYSQLPQRYRNALDNSDYVSYQLNIDDETKKSYDTDGNGIISPDEAKKHNIIVRTTYDNDGNPTQDLYYRHTDFSDLDKEGVRNFFMRDEFNKGDFSRLQKRIFKEIGDQHTAEQKQELAKGLMRAQANQAQAKVYEKRENAFIKSAFNRVKADRFNQDWNIGFDDADIIKAQEIINNLRKQGDEVNEQTYRQIANQIMAEKNKFNTQKPIEGITQEENYTLSQLGEQFTALNDSKKRKVAEIYRNTYPAAELKALGTSTAPADNVKRFQILRKADKEWKKHAKKQGFKIDSPWKKSLFSTYIAVKENANRRAIENADQRIKDALAKYEKYGYDLDKLKREYGIHKRAQIEMGSLESNPRVHSEYEVIENDKKADAQYFKENILPHIEGYAQRQAELKNLRKDWNKLTGKII